MRWFLIVLLLLTGTAHADELDPPGLSSDVSSYQQSLRAKSPASLTTALKLQAEQRTVAAVSRGDWTAAIAALETRLSASDGTPDHCRPTR